MTIRSWISSIMGLIGPEQPVICPCIKKKDCYISLCLLSSIYKYEPIGTKLGQNIYDHKISNEFDYGSNWIRTTAVVCP